MSDTQNEPSLVADDPRDTRQRLIFVTGPAGAGRSTAIHVLEDLGYEAIDNLPLSLIPRLLDGPPRNRPLALGIDARNRDFSIANLSDLLDRLSVNANYAPELLYLDCSPDALVRRYSETRRRHPLAPDEPPLAGIEAEREMLAPIRSRAEVLIDTTDLSPHDLKSELARWFDLAGNHRLTVSLHSFSYKRGVPRGLDMMFDCRFLANPHWRPELRSHDGREGPVQDYVTADPLYAPFFDKVRDLVLFVLPAHLAEGKAHLAIGFGCTGGKHRSVTLTEKLGEALAQAGWRVSIRHRELEHRGAALPLNEPAPA
ncbi:RNase adapter RapZ [Paracoccus suum]|uniref:RNase adapter RapZ n=1 Tax=Paracoccus suum TaxID=2259340 RepID=A0A344PIW5_9RHOB|nr:RNase adapter RapZ [Paracoccus suum]AXC49320.1 RNase adapter RapZ [Paracoccus suum]